MCHRKTIIKFAGILLLCLSIYSFQKPIAPISPVRPAIRVDSFLLQTARFEQAGNWVGYEKRCLESEQDAAYRKDAALEAAVNLRKAQFETIKNSFDRSISGHLFEKSLRYFEKSDTAIWQLDAARIGLAICYSNSASSQGIKAADSLLQLVFDSKRKPLSAFAADALFLFGSIHKWSPEISAKENVLGQLWRITNYRKEYELLLQAATAINNRNSNLAESLLQQAEAILLKRPGQDEAKSVLAELYLRIGRDYFPKNKKKGFELIEKVLSFQSPRYNSSDSSGFCPDAEHFIPDYWSLLALQEFAYQQLQVDSSGRLSKVPLQSLTGLMSIIQNHLYTPVNRTIWYGSLSVTISTLIGNSLKNYKKNNSVEDLQELFFLSERMNAHNLWNGTKILNGREPSDSLQALEQRLAIDQSFWTFQVNKLQALNDTKLLSYFEARLKEVKKQREELHTVLLKKQKKYLTLKFGAQIPKLKELQSKLDADMQILSYLNINNSPYLLSFNSTAAKLVALDSNLYETVSEFKQLIVTNAKAPDFAKKSNELYKKLIPALYSENKRLLIIPSTELNGLPFDMLCTEAAKDEDKFKTLSYLFKKHRISYQFSISSWFEKHNLPLNPVSYYIMSMSNSKDSLAGLHTDYLLSRFSATTFKGMESKKEDFLEQAPRYGFIHLGITANESELIFSNEKLSLNELEAIELNAALVLMPHLSAPSSFIVEMAFLQAGAGSLISSLWNVSEESESAELVKYFYENLQKGLSKDEALRRARMEYLEKMPEDKLAPIYWGQFRQVGDFRSVSISEPISYIWWYLLPIVGLLGIGWWAMGALRQRR